MGCKVCTFAPVCSLICAVLFAAAVVGSLLIAINDEDTSATDDWWLTSVEALGEAYSCR